MMIDNRIDPVGIIARVGDFTSQEQALKDWVRLAKKAQWQVELVDEFPLDAEAGDCGAVEVEGLRYLIHLTPHVRMLLVDDTDGKVTKRPVFSHAAWAEPIVEEEGFVPYFGN
ncbi:hypothetical protein P1S61_35025 [Streptomyces sp. ME08-AFT2]|uniref:hypothetical protein n=1 Tax=unclassified Streptomyces TaxID=2593676 RepID=UPI0029BA68B4|nr:hypothetical protein [Streptomyces sp. ME08-AFT2]MDX3314187.1 hypothetical protein [Streptomyces sp. ME08-AFT2]